MVECGINNSGAPAGRVQCLPGSPLAGRDRFFHRHVAGFKHEPRLSLLHQGSRRLPASLEPIMAADFVRIIVGHGQVIERDGKALLARALADEGVG